LHWRSPSGVERLRDQSASKFSDVSHQRIKKADRFLRSALDRIPSTGRRPIVTKTAAEPNGAEALKRNPVAVLWVWIMSHPAKTGQARFAHENALVIPAERGVNLPVRKSLKYCQGARLRLNFQPSLGTA